jgi:hypothetical protein
MAARIKKGWVGGIRVRAERGFTIDGRDRQKPLSSSRSGTTFFIDRLMHDAHTLSSNAASEEADAPPILTKSRRPQQSRQQEASLEDDYPEY